MINELINSRDSKIIPKWFLRQSGRHITEYFSIRNRHENFIDFCLDETSIVDATLLPLKYYNVDAAILFSDILLLPYCLGQEVTFRKGLGPLLKEIEISDTFLQKQINFNDLNPIKNAIEKLKNLIAPKKELIGFCGAPWTLSCYILEGGSSKDYVKTRTFLWNEEKTFIKLINKLTNDCVSLLEYQYLAGATVLMIFDTWSNMIPDRYWSQFGIEPTKYIIDRLREKNVKCPIIGLPFKSGEMLIKYSYESTVDIISIDWKTKNINNDIVTQGNLDPVLLACNNFHIIKDEVHRILDLTKDRCHIFNVGHGLIPEVKIDNVNFAIELIESY